jgi:hypothetical protein
MQNKGIFMRTKRTIWMPILAALLIAAVLVSTAGAGSFHFNSVSFSLGSLDMTGQLAGIGNSTAYVTLTGYGTVKALCENNGGNQAPGRNPIAMQVSQTSEFVTNSNGNALVQVSAQDPTLSQISPSPTPKTAGCPSSKWTVVGIVDGSTNWTGANIIVKDEYGQIQANLSYKCATYFTNGVATSIACTQS